MLEISFISPSKECQSLLTGCNHPSITCRPSQVASLLGSYHSIVVVAVVIVVVAVVIVVVTVVIVVVIFIVLIVVVVVGVVV